MSNNLKYVHKVIVCLGYDQNNK